MKTMLIAAIMLLSLLAVGSFAQQGPRMYDPKTVETISGEVISVTQTARDRGWGQGVHLIVKTDKETISAHLGPAWYLETQDMKIEPKDKVEIKGSRITFNGKPAIIAAEVKKENKTLKLRDENGLPVWRGGRQR